MYTAWHCKAERRPRGMYVVRTRENQDTIYTTHFARDQGGAYNFWLSQSDPIKPMPKVPINRSMHDRRLARSSPLPHNGQEGTRSMLR